MRLIRKAKIVLGITVLLLFSVLLLGQKSVDSPPIYISFLWHMHQPIYWPYESIVQTEGSGAYGFSVIDVHHQRSGPYTDWPIHAVESGMYASSPTRDHFGVQVSFSGSLMENLDNLKASGDWSFGTWESRWKQGRGYSTVLGNPRIDMVAFGYHHPIMPLIDAFDLGLQIEDHRQTFCENFGCSVPYSRGMFPPENGFGPEVIPAIAAQGVEWIMVDNFHLQRACQGYPWNSGGGVSEPNPADQINPDPGDWVSLMDLWAGTQVSAQWSYQPHWAEYVDPQTGQAQRIIVVPAARYMGNEDGRGGFGALQYDKVMSQLEPYNTDADHPILILLHHDGDNHGAGSESYYHHNFDNFVNWLQSNPSRFVCTTIEDYLEMFPPDPADVIHFEDGSWAGADSGDPEYKKWLGDPGSGGYSSDRTSWAALVAAGNRVRTAEAINPYSAHTQQAWRYLLNGQTSCYFYWDGQDPWDSHPTRASNMAAGEADWVIGSGPDTVGPTLFPPQREPYNPGGLEWGEEQPSDFTVWTLAYDLAGVTGCTLYYRVDGDGANPLDSHDNETYAGGPEVGAWVGVAMAAQDLPPAQTSPMPAYRARLYEGQITGQEEVLLDYYVEAQDSLGNVSRSAIKHVYVGVGGGTSENPAVMWSPENPESGGRLSIYYDPVAGTLPDDTDPVYIHIGHSGWQGILSPDPEMGRCPLFDHFTPKFPGLTLPAGNDVAGLVHVFRDLPLFKPRPDRPGLPHGPHSAPGGLQEVVIPITGVLQLPPSSYWVYQFDIPAYATSIDFVFTDGMGHWDNNEGRDWIVPCGGGLN